MVQSQFLQPVLYTDGDVELESLITSNSTKNAAGVLILPAWFGIDTESKNAALSLQSQGYKAMVVDIYGKNNIPKTNQEASKLSSWYKTHFEIYQTRIRLALSKFIINGANPEKIAVIGYCFGGTGALEAARGKLAVEGIVCIHGSLYKDPVREIEAINTKILVEYPANDHTISHQDYENFKEEMNKSNADWQIITYGNSNHSFTNPNSADYHKKMADRAWSHTLLFLQDVLKESFIK